MALTAVVIPTLDTPAPLARLLAELPDGVRAYVVDDGSAVPVRAPVHVLRHERTRGYGAAQKTGYRAALDDGAERVVLLHGDGQYDTAQTVALADALVEADGVLGSRLLGPTTAIPPWRLAGNRALTGLANLRFGARFSDLHTGARAWCADTLREVAFDRLSDDFVFDQQILCAALRAGLRLVERPVASHYGAGSRSIAPLRAVVYGIGCVREIAR